MKMKLLMESWRKFANSNVEEGIDPETGFHDGKYYAFDWDDNLLFMPTKIYLKDGDETIEIGTEEFANIRTKIGKPGPYKNYSYLPDDASFRNFREEGNEQFLADVESGPKVAPAWKDFIECLNTASIFAIITARGHNPEILEQAVKILIDKNYQGISQSKIEKSLERYAELLDEPVMTIEEYLNKCHFYPVSHGIQSGAASPQELKAQRLEDFKKYVYGLNQKMKQHAVAVPKLGFSDDDRANFEYVKERFPDLVVKFTGHGPR
jgi:hypothetical protein